MKRFGTRSAGLMVGLALALMIGVQPAAASEILKMTGHTGDFGTYDSYAESGGRCGYGAANINGSQPLRWMKVFTPIVAARDVTSGVDHQKITWRVVIQRSVNGPSGPWKALVKSSIKTTTGYDNHGGQYSTTKVNVSGKDHVLYRAVSVLSWMRHGAVEGVVKLRTENYSNDWTVGAPDYIAVDYCVGLAD